MIEFNEDEFKTLGAALHILRQKLPDVISWKIDLGNVNYGQNNLVPFSIVPFRELYINGRSIKVRSITQSPLKESQP